MIPIHPHPESPASSPISLQMWLSAQPHHGIVKCGGVPLFFRIFLEDGENEESPGDPVHPEELPE